MRNAFADELTALAREDDRVVMLSGDIGNRLFDKFKEAQGDRFFNCGVAEQNMMGVAAGMAMSGLRPVAYTIAPFVTTRCLEQIRTDAAYHEAPVTIVAVGAGLAYAGLGPTHHACEDISFLRSIPGMLVLAPGDEWEVRAALRAILQQDQPAYLRLGKKGEPVIHPQAIADFEIGRAIQLTEGDDVCILSTGNILPEARAAAEILESQRVTVRLVSFHTVKPLDGPCLENAFSTFACVATVEEHSLVGGFGSAVAEWAVDAGVAVQKLVRIGTPDKFFKESGKQAYARERLGLNSRSIADRILAALAGGRRGGE